MRTACRKGHVYVEGSYYWDINGNRQCKMCQKIRSEENRNRKKVEEYHEQFRAEAAKLRVNGG